MAILAEYRSEVRLEQAVVNIEYRLSHWAAIPLVGSVGGGIKMGLGTIETISGIVVGLFSAPKACRSMKARHKMKRSFSHVVNGIANIGAGALESIPGMGTAIFGLRKFRKEKDMKTICYYTSGQEHTMIIGFSSLEEYAEVKGDPQFAARTRPCILV